VRWTLGDVSSRGFEALRLSVWGAWKLFGDEARYGICVNSISLAHAQRETGSLPAQVLWRAVDRRDLPPVLDEVLDPGMAEGAGWKLAPTRLFPAAFELALDNDCILWRLPPSVRQWITNAERDRCVMAEDVNGCFGQVTDLCGGDPRNAGIRGFPPGFDLSAAVRLVIERCRSRRGRAVRLASETDEQGLQTASLSIHSPPATVTLAEVSICSPFHPHLPNLGSCGAHFVGLNAHHIPWNYYDRPADEWIKQHWHRHLPELYIRTGADRRAPVVETFDSVYQSLEG